MIYSKNWIAQRDQIVLFQDWIAIGKDTLDHCLKT